MENTYSLKLEEIFQIHGRCTFLVPIFDLPKVSGFKPFHGNVEVLLPDGKKKKYTAQFELMHFMMNILGKLVGRWRIVILLPKAKKTDITIESEVVVTDAIAIRLMAIEQYPTNE